MREEMKELRGAMKTFCEETAQPFRITKVEKFENLELGFVEEVYKNDTKTKHRKAIIIHNDWQVSFSHIRLTIRVKESKDKNTRKDQFHAVFHHMESRQSLQKFSHELERVSLDQAMIFQSSSHTPLKLKIHRLTSYAFNEMPSDLTLCIISLT